MEKLDKIVLDGLLDRVLRPERLTALLAAVLDMSDAADEQRQKDLERMRRARLEMETKLRRLLDLVAEGLMDLTAQQVGAHVKVRNLTFKDHIGNLKAARLFAGKTLIGHDQRHPVDTVLKDLCARL